MMTLLYIPTNNRVAAFESGGGFRASGSEGDRSSVLQHAVLTEYSPSLELSGSQKKVTLPPQPGRAGQKVAQLLD